MIRGLFLIIIFSQISFSLERSPSIQKHVDWVEELEGKPIDELERYKPIKNSRRNSNEEEILTRML